MTSKKNMTTKEKIARAKELLKSQEVYDFVLDLMGNPRKSWLIQGWATEEDFSRGVKDVCEAPSSDNPKDWDAYRAKRAAKLEEMHDLLLNDGVRISICIQVAQECGFAENVSLKFERNIKGIVPSSRYGRKEFDHDGLLLEDDKFKFKEPAKRMKPHKVVFKGLARLFGAKRRSSHARDED